MYILTKTSAIFRTPSLLDHEGCKSRHLKYRNFPPFPDSPYSEFSTFENSPLQATGNQCVAKAMLSEFRC